MKEIIQDVFDRDAINKIKSQRLLALVTFCIPQENVIQKKKKKAATKKGKIENQDDENLGIFPNFDHIIENFEKMIQWKKVGSKKVPEPIKGLNEEFDIANSNVEKLKVRLAEYLEEVRQ